MSPRERATWILVIGIFALYGSKITGGLGIERLGWGLPSIYQDCSFHLHSCIGAALTSTTSYWSPAAQLWIDFTTSLFPKSIWPFVFSGSGILLLAFNATLLMSLLHRLCHRLDLAFSLAIVYALLPSHWPMTQWHQFIPGEFALFFCLSSWLYMLAASQHAEGKGVRILMASLCFAASLMFHPAALCLLLLPFAYAFWQTDKQGLILALTSALSWITITLVWWMKSNLYSDASISFYDFFAYAGRAVAYLAPPWLVWATLGLATVTVTIWRRDFVLASLALILIGFPLLLSLFKPDPMLQLNALPPVYIAFMAILVFAALSLILSQLSSRWLYLPLPVVAIAAALTWHGSKRLSDAPIASHALAPVLAQLFSEYRNDDASKDSLVHFYRQYQGLWQMRWLEGEINDDVSTKIALFNEARKIDPRPPYPHFSLINAEIARENFQGALSESARAEELFKDNMRWKQIFKGYHGISMARLGHVQAGILKMQQALPWLATDKTFLREMARAYQQIGDRKGAMQVAIRLRRLDM